MYVPVPLVSLEELREDGFRVWLRNMGTGSGEHRRVETGDGEVYVFVRRGGDGTATRGVCDRCRMSNSSSSGEERNSIRVEMVRRIQVWSTVV
jgi:hypothetical protein